jgi:hypothetical protein
LAQLGHVLDPGLRSARLEIHRIAPHVHGMRTFFALAAILIGVAGLNAAAAQKPSEGLRDYSKMVYTRNSPEYRAAYLKALGNRENCKTPLYDAVINGRVVRGKSPAEAQACLDALTREDRGR